MVFKALHDAQAWSVPQLSLSGAAKLLHTQHKASHGCSVSAGWFIFSELVWELTLFLH